jgi:hypothetical protein
VFVFLVMLLLAALLFRVVAFFFSLSKKVSTRKNENEYICFWCITRRTHRLASRQQDRSARASEYENLADITRISGQPVVETLFMVGWRWRALELV